MKKNYKKGFSLVEIMLSVALIAILIPAFVAAFHFSIFSTAQGEDFSVAYALAQEQMEGIYYVKSFNDDVWDWENTPVENSTGSFYHLEKSGDSWTLANGPIQNGRYTKKLTINYVRRLEDGTLSNSGILDENSRYVTVYIEWTENGQPQEVSLESIVTKY